MVTDLRMPGLTGMDVLRHVTKSNPGVPVVVLTAYGTVEGAVDAVRSGASDFLMKPVEIPRLRAAVFKAVKERGDAPGDRAVEGRGGARARSGGDHRVVPSHGRGAPQDPAGRPDPDERAYHGGKRGRGKELVARAIHALSPRTGRPFLPLNCAAIPEALLESELFGHEKGAFTGAVAARPGKLESAEGGTLFLDEVGDVSLAIQAKLLRAIEQKEVVRVGSSQVLQVDVRILAATNQDLKTLVEKKGFREDLYYRLNVFGILVPPLRERREDIPKLSGHFLELLARESSASPKKLAPAALKALLAYRWPGNVRQLRNALETAILVSGGDVIELADLPGRGDAGDRISVFLRADSPSRFPHVDRDRAGRHQGRPRQDRRATRRRRRNCWASGFAPCIARSRSTGSTKPQGPLPSRSGAPCGPHPRKPPPRPPGHKPPERSSLRKVRTGKLSISGQAGSGDILRFINRGRKGKNVPRPARTAKLPIQGQAGSGDILRFINRGRKGKNVPRPCLCDTVSHLLSLPKRHAFSWASPRPLRHRREIE